MGIEEAIINRRSVRKYLPGPVPNDMIIRLLDIARWAPTATNRQEYYFIIVDDKVIISQIVNAGGSRVLLNSDKVVFVLYGSLTDNLEYADHIQSASAIVQNFLLLAYEKGIGACWINHLPRKKALNKLLNISDNIEVISAISLGYADLKDIKPVERKCQIKDIVGYNSFYAKGKILKNKKMVFIKIILNRLYYLFPVFLKKRVNGFLDRYCVKKFEN